MFDSEENSKVFNVYLDLSETGLGLSIRGGTDSSNSYYKSAIYISQILPNGAVACDGRLQLGIYSGFEVTDDKFVFFEGDILQEVNGTSLINVKHDQAVAAIKQAGKYLHFKVERIQKILNESDDSETFSLEESNDDRPLIKEQDSKPIKEENRSNIFQTNDLIKVELIRNEKGFGLSLVGGIDNCESSNDPGLYVCNIVDGGPTHKDGRIQVGDQVYAINDICLEKVPYGWAIECIRSQPELSIFTIKKQINWN